MSFFLSVLPFLLFECSCGLSGLPQTVYQQARFEEVSKQAKAASDAAFPQLLSALDDPKVRDLLATSCPSLAKKPAEDFLRILREQHSSAEIVSGFHSGGATVLSWDMSVPEGRKTNWFENQWEVRVRNGGSFRGLGWFKTQDDVETKLYGLKTFAKRGSPSSMEEAGERGIYASLNAFRCDSGATLYGDISAVFSSELLRNIALISAIDTGGWTALCNGTQRKGWPPAAYRTNCSAYNFTLGTLDHLDHLILANLQYWQRDIPSMLALQLSRSCPESNHKNDIHSTELFQYWEVMPAGQLQFPKSIKLLVANFPSIFGTRAGSALQSWCIERGWALAWSLGLNVGIGMDYWSIGLTNRVYRQNGRILDPLVLPSTAIVNFPVSDDIIAAFKKTWDKVHSRRRIWLVSNKTWAGFWNDLITGLPPTFHIDIPKPGVCEDMDRCIGVTYTGACVCYKSNGVVM